MNFLVTSPNSKALDVYKRQRISRRNLVRNTFVDFSQTTGNNLSVANFWVVQGFYFHLLFLQKLFLRTRRKTALGDRRTPYRNAGFRTLPKFYIINVLYYNTKQKGLHRLFMEFTKNLHSYAKIRFKKEKISNVIFLQKRYLMQKILFLFENKK